VSDTHLPSERELLLVETARLGCTNKKFKLRDVDSGCSPVAGPGVGLAGLEVRPAVSLSGGIPPFRERSAGAPGWEGLSACTRDGRLRP
jgi:hypothetical protein